MKLVIKFPTRARPEKFKNILSRYVDFLTGDNHARFVITCDNDDETMNNSEMINWMDRMSTRVDLVYHFGDNKTKVEAVNADLENETGDVLLVVSDDMMPASLNYDAIITEAFEKIFPNYDGAIKFSDGLRDDQLMTLPCMGWKLYKAIGHVYHPDYTSLFCDNEQTRLCAMLGKLAVADVCIARHEWVPGEHDLADELHKRNESFYKEDIAIFKERSDKNYDVEKVKEILNELVPVQS